MKYVASSDEVNKIHVARRKVPIFKIEYFDSPYMVPSRGMEMRVYNGTEFAGSDLSFVGYDNILSHDWSKNGPPGTAYSYCVQWLGYFYAKYSGAYTFFLTCSDSARICMSTSQSVHPSGLQAGDILSMQMVHNAMESMSSRDDSWERHIDPYTYKASIVLTEGTWYPIRVDFKKFYESDNNGLGTIVVQYIEPRYVANSSGEYSDNEPCAFYDVANEICNAVGSNAIACSGAHWGIDCFYGELHNGQGTTVSGHLFPVIHKKILSAGVVNYGNGDGWRNAADSMVDFIQPVELGDIIAAQGNKRTGEVSQYLVTIPLGTNSSSSYFFDGSADNFFSTKLGTYIRKNRLVKIYSSYQTKCNNYSAGTCSLGYDLTASGLWWSKNLCSNGGNNICPHSTPTDNDWVGVFTGVISDFRINRSDSTITLVCDDFMSFIQTSINENYPNIASYAAGGGVTGDTLFLHNKFNSFRPNGELQRYSRDVVNAYDGWPVGDAIRDILTKCGIDPTLQYGRKKIINVDGTYSWGDYFIESNKYVLSAPKNFGYGDSTVIADEKEKKDDKYIWGSDFGSYLNDIYGRIADFYGVITGFTDDGYAKFLPYNVSKILHPSQIGWDKSSGASLTTDINAYRGAYLNLGSSDDWASVNFNGSSMDLIMTLVSGNVHNKFNLIHDMLLSTQYSSFNSVFRNRGGYGKMGVDFDYLHVGHIIGHHKYSRNRSSDSQVSVSGMTYYCYFIPKVTMEINSLSMFCESAFRNKNIGMNVNISIGHSYYGAGHSSPTAPLFYVHPAFRNGKHTIISNWDPFATDVVSGRTSFVLTKEFDFPYTISGNQTYLIEFKTDDIVAYGTPLTDSDIGFYKYQIPLDGIKTRFWFSDSYNDSGIAHIMNTYLHVSDGGECVGFMGAADTTIGDMGYMDSTTIHKNESTVATQSMPDIAFLGSNINSLVRVWAVRDGTTVFDKYVCPIIPSGLVGEWGLMRYFLDGEDIGFYGSNPTVFPISAMDLVGQNEYGSINSYGNYTLYVSGGNGYCNIEGVRIFEIDTDSPLHEFNTYGRNADLFELDVNASTSDLRNDVIVVGGEKGAVINEAINRTLNSNNPRIRYYFSRITDISSIYDLNHRDNIGLRKPIIVYEPSIISDEQADAIANAVIQKYSKSIKDLQFVIPGMPDLELDDCVYVNDSHTGILSHNGKRQWVLGISDEIKNGSFITTIESSSSKRWNSVEFKDPPDSSLFGRNCVVNVKLTDDTGLVRISGNGFGPVYDPYESEGTSYWHVGDLDAWTRQLMGSFNVVIPGEYLIYVIPMIDIKNSDFSHIENTNFSSMSTEIPVAYLRPGKNPSSEMEWFYLGPGSYEVYWDGVDYSGVTHGFYSMSALAKEEDMALNLTDSPVYCHDGSYCIVFKRRNIGEYSYANEKGDTIVSSRLNSLYNDSDYGVQTQDGGNTHSCFWDIVKGPGIRLEVITYRDDDVPGIQLNNNVFPHSYGYRSHGWHDVFTSDLTLGLAIQNDFWNKLSSHGDKSYIEFHESDNGGRGLKIAFYPSVSGNLDLGNKRLMACAVKNQFWRATWMLPETKYSMDKDSNLRWQGSDPGVEDRCKALSFHGHPAHCVGPIVPIVGDSIGGDDGRDRENVWRRLTYGHMTLWSDAHPMNNLTNDSGYMPKYPLVYLADGGSSVSHTDPIYNSYVGSVFEGLEGLGDYAARGILSLKSPLNEFDVDELGKIEMLEFQPIGSVSLYIDINQDAFKLDGDKKLAKFSMSKYMTPDRMFPSNSDDINSKELMEFFSSLSDPNSAGVWPKSVLFANAFWLKISMWDRSGRSILLASGSHVAQYLDNTDMRYKFIAFNDCGFVNREVIGNAKYNMMFVNGEVLNEHSDNDDHTFWYYGKTEFAKTNEFYIRAFWSPVGDRIWWEDYSKFSSKVVAGGAWGFDSIWESISKDPENYPITTSGFVWVDTIKLVTELKDGDSVSGTGATIDRMPNGAIKCKLFKMYYLISNLRTFVNSASLGDLSVLTPFPPCGPLGSVDAEYE